MAENGANFPSDSRPEAEPELHDFEEEVAADQIDSRQWESNRKMACVLMGNAMLQLPIWGKLSP
jgi:hypothetical protein